MQKLNDTTNVLLIEEGPSRRKQFQQAISKLSLSTQLTVTTTLQAGLKRLLAKRYDILFSNYSMLTHTIPSFLQTARKKNTKMPIVLISDKNQQKEQVKAKNIHWIDSVLVTPEGLDYIIQVALKYAAIRQQIEVIEKDMAPMMEHLPMFIFFIDEEGIIQYAKGESLGVLKLSPDMQFVKKSIYKIAKKYPDFIRHIKTALQGKQVKGIDLLIGDIVFDVSCIPSMTSEGQVKGVYGIAKDCTARAHDQKTLLRAKQDTDRNALLKEQFSANISHEIRTPMNAILGFSNLLMQEKLTDHQLLYAKSIKQSSENLLVIIDGILDFSKISAKKLKIKKIPFNLTEALVILETTIKVQLGSSDITLNVDIDEQVPTYVIGDSVRLSQILLNLLSNAVKFTKIGSVDFSVSVKEHTDRQVILLFKVKDTGIGIPKREQKNIFERFTQVENETIQKRGGTGLGLAISKYLVKLQKGIISLESEENKGSTFFVEMPFGLSKKSLKGQGNHVLLKKNTSLIKNKKVLLVEDNAMNQLLAETHLKMWDMQVDTVENGRLAIEKVQKNLYDIILMDVQMPVLNGIEATRIIRLEHTAKKLPIVAMTAHALPTEQKKCLEVGMNGYIIKPYKANEIKNLITKLFKKKNYEYSNPIPL